MILLDTNLLTRMMRSHEPRIARLLTFNGGHFRSLPVTVLDPASP